MGVLLSSHEIIALASQKHCSSIAKTTPCGTNGLKEVPWGLFARYHGHRVVILKKSGRIVVLFKNFEYFCGVQSKQDGNPIEQ